MGKFHGVMTPITPMGIHRHLNLFRSSDASSAEERRPSRHESSVDRFLDVAARLAFTLAISCSEIGQLFLASARLREAKRTRRAFVRHHPPFCRYALLAAATARATPSAAERGKTRSPPLRRARRLEGLAYAADPLPPMRFWTYASSRHEAI